MCVHIRISVHIRDTMVVLGAWDHAVDGGKLAPFSGFQIIGQEAISAHPLFNIGW